MKTKMQNGFAVIMLCCISIAQAQPWTQVASMPGLAGRYRAVSFTIGDKAYVTTGQTTTTTLSSTWEYDPIADAWSQKADFAGGHRRVAAGFSVGNFGYVGTGRDDNETLNMIHNDFWKFDPVLNTWTQIANYPAGNRETLVTFSIGNFGYAGLGLAGSPKTEFYKFDPVSESWIQLQNIDINNHLYNCAQFTLNGKGYLAAGSGRNSSGNPFTTSAVYMYDPETDSWTQKNNFGGGARQYASGFTVGGNAYVGLGYTGTYVSDIWKYNESADSWTQDDNFTGGARAHSSAFTLNGTAYIGNGYSPSLPALTTFYKWQPTLSSGGFKSDEALQIVVNKDEISFSASIKFDRLDVHSSVGQLVLSVSLDSKSNDTIQHNLPAGVYICRIRNSKDGTESSRKIVIP